MAALHLMAALLLAMAGAVAGATWVPRRAGSKGEALNMAQLREQLFLEEDAEAPNMTVDAALDILRHLKGAPRGLATEVEQLLDHRRQRGSGTFLQTHTVDEPDAYKQVDETRATLNMMIRETLAKKDNETLRCMIFMTRQNRLIEESKQDIAAFTSTATQARADILKAQAKIGNLKLKTLVVMGQLTEHKTNCAQVSASYAQQIALISGDIGVMTGVVKLAECAPPGAAAAASLLHCKKRHLNVTRGSSFLTMPHEWLSEKIAQLRSPSAKHLVLKFLKGVEMPSHKESVELLQSVQQPIPLSESKNLPNPEEETAEAKCTVSRGPNCRRLFSKFINILGGLRDKKQDLEKQLSRFRSECSNTQVELEATMDGHATNLRAAQTELAKSTKKLTDSEESARLERINLKELRQEKQDERRTCRDTKGQLRDELCGLRKIRTQMGTMTGSSETFFLDCEVSGWVAEECSAPCGGGRLTQHRTITRGPQGGASCPELEMHMDCNMFPCPVDCKLEDWSGFSECSAECGGGVRERSRNIIVEPEHNGEPCDDTTETWACNVQDCDAECVLGEWSQWSPCSKQCGTGSKSAMRPVVKEAMGQGTCPELHTDAREKRVVCNEHPCPPVLECDAKIDLMLIIDGSSSLGQDGWDAMKAASHKIISGMKGGADSVEAAAVLFTGPETYDEFDWCLAGDPRANPETSCGLKKVSSFTTDTAGLAANIQGLEWPGGTTFTSYALQTARTMLQEGRPDAASVVVVLTDGDPISPMETYQSALDIRNQARLFFVAVGASVTMNNLKLWASWPVDENVVRAKNFTLLESNYLVNDIIADVCPHLVESQ